MQTRITQCSEKVGERPRQSVYRRVLRNQSARRPGWSECRMSDFQVGHPDRAPGHDAAAAEPHRTANGALFAKCADCNGSSQQTSQASLAVSIRALREKRSVCGSVPLGSPSPGNQCPRSFPSQRDKAVRIEEYRAASTMAPTPRAMRKTGHSALSLSQFCCRRTIPIARKMSPVPR